MPMFVTAPAKVPYTREECEAMVELGLGGEGKSRNIVISEQQLRLLARGLRVLHGLEDGAQITAVESAMLGEMSVMFDDVAEDNTKAIHGICL